MRSRKLSNVQQAIKQLEAAAKFLENRKPDATDQDACLANIRGAIANLKAPVEPKITLPKCPKGMIPLVVLDDGETYSGIHGEGMTGASVAYVTDNEMERIMAISGGEKDVFDSLPPDRRFMLG